MINEEKNSTDAINMSDEMERGFSELDRHRAAGLEALFTFQTSQQTADARNFARLRRKYGDDHSRVRETAAKIETSGSFIAGLKRELIKTQTVAPAAQADAWTLYGYILDEQNDAVAGADVLLFDKRGQRLTESGTAKTDQTGFFLLRIKNVGELPAQIYAGTSADCLSDQTVAPAAGTVDYAYVTVTVEDEKSSSPDKPAGEPIPTGKNFFDWMVTGKVTASGGAGIPGLKVRVFDKDLAFDDALGAAETDAHGVYRLTFTKKQFSDFGENYPELYLVIEDAAGRILFDGKRESRGHAGRIELIDVQLDNIEAE